MRRNGLDCKVYHGWIFAEKSPGMKDVFSVQYRGDDGTPLSKSCGYGEMGAAKAVDFFEKIHGPVKLESTPLGLRVYTQEVKRESTDI